MHEYYITVQIVKAVLDEAQKHNSKRVSEVHLTLGRFTLLGTEQVRFWYKVLVDETIIKGSKLCIEEKNGEVLCRNCEYKGPIKLEDDPVYHILFPTLRCPKCGSLTEIVGGRECTVKSVKLVVQS
jgi:hydrogenase nickel insertion protein HypA